MSEAIIGNFIADQDGIQVKILGGFCGQLTISIIDLDLGEQVYRKTYSFLQRSQAFIKFHHYKKVFK